jgi:uncharacterized protein YgbK (DUF1537 family)
MKKIFFIGDDFTGASDNAAQYSRHGLKTVLLFDLPDLETLGQLIADNDVVGIATATRSMGRHDIVQTLAPILSLVKRLDVDIVQYKCCSTFDSSDGIGNLALALRMMRDSWPGSFSPVYIATPEFGRYTLFSNHYAVFDGKRYRLDRHPVMANHPATPMSESDIRLILKNQGFETGGVVDVVELDRRMREGMYAQEEGAESVVFDGYTLDHSQAVARIVLNVAETRTITALAAQGFAEGVGRCLASERKETGRRAHCLSATDKILVLSGSCSTTSWQQIEHAESIGFRALRIEPRHMVADDQAPLQSLADEAIAFLKAGESVILYTALGQDDPAIGELNRLMGQKKMSGNSSRVIGGVFASILRQALAQTDLQRVVVAGGDCSSHAMTQAEAHSIEMTVSHFSHNAHMGRVRSADRSIDGKEFLLKGGQVGRPNLYEDILHGFNIQG